MVVQEIIQQAVMPWLLAEVVEHLLLGEHQHHLQLVLVVMDLLFILLLHQHNLHHKTHLLVVVEEELEMQPIVNLVREQKELVD